MTWIGNMLAGIALFVNGVVGGLTGGIHRGEPVPFVPTTSDVSAHATSSITADIQSNPVKKTTVSIPETKPVTMPLSAPLSPAAPTMVASTSVLTLTWPSSFTRTVHINEPLYFSFFPGVKKRTSYVLVTGIHGNTADITLSNPPLDSQTRNGMTVGTKLDGQHYEDGGGLFPRVFITAINEDSVVILLTSFQGSIW